MEDPPSGPPCLVELCVRTLARHVDALEDIGEADPTLVAEALRRGHAEAAVLKRLEDAQRTAEGRRALRGAFAPLWRVHFARLTGKRESELPAVGELPAKRWRAGYEEVLERREAKKAKTAQRVRALYAQDATVKAAATVKRVDLPLPGGGRRAAAAAQVL